MFNQYSLKRKNELQGKKFISFSDGTERKYKIESVIGESVKVKCLQNGYHVHYSVSEVCREFVLERWKLVN
jgi:hypothetical protein